METETPMTPVAQEKKAPKRVGLTILIVLFALAAIGLGIWGKMTTDKTAATLGAEAALEAKYDTLFAENGTALTDLETAKGELETAKADLEKAKKELATTQENLTRVNENVAKLQADIDKSLVYIDVISAVFVDQDNLEVARRLAAVKDQTLEEKFNKFTQSGSEADFTDWLKYLMTSIANLLK